MTLRIKMWSIVGRMGSNSEKISTRMQFVGTMYLDLMGGDLNMVHAVLYQ